jgi:hypothetical protein
MARYRVVGWSGRRGYRRPVPKRRCTGGDNFRDFDGSAGFMDCREPATHRMVIDERAWGWPGRARVELCGHHAGLVGPEDTEVVRGPYRFRRVA